MSEVPAVRTPTPDTSLVPAMRAAYVEQLGHAPSSETLAILLGQIALECGHGGECMNFNLGNYKRGPGPDWCSFQTFEYVGTPPVRTEMVCEFSAWPTLEDATAFFVAGLFTRYPEAWAAAVAGDAQAFAAGLRQRGYYTAPLAAYAAGVRRWQGYYLALLGGDPSPTEPEILSPADAGVLATTGLLDGPSSGPTLPGT